jgi:HemY protein
MRALFWALLLAVVAAALALLLRLDLGNVVFLVPPQRIDLSVNLFVAVVVLAGALLYWTARFVQMAVDFPERVRSYRLRRDELGGQQALREAVKALLEGRFARAEKAARTAQSAPALAGVAALIGARAAHRLQQYERRDAWLAQIETDSALRDARLVSSAEMWAEQRQNERALEAIDALHGTGARYLHALRIALNAYLQSNRWPEALRTLRVLEKRKAIHPLVAERLRLATHYELLLAQRHDAAQLETTWLALPAAERNQPQLALEAARLLHLAGRGRVAAQAIEAALPQAELDAATRLIDEYGRISVLPLRAQIERVEGWLRQPPALAAAAGNTALRAALLRCLGLLCIKQQLWGKAKSSLTESLHLQVQPTTLLALAQLVETMGEQTQAAAYFREAALGLANQLSAQPSSPGLNLSRASSARDHTL